MQLLIYHTWEFIVLMLQIKNIKIIFLITITGERFRLYEGHFEIISEEYPDGCHTNVPGDDVSSDRWELADEEENVQ